MIGQFTHPNQVVCEGKADETFLHRLLDAHGIAVNVSCPTLADGALGNSGIRRRLTALRASGTSRRVIVVVDSDNHPENALGIAQTEFREANLRNPDNLYEIPGTINVLTEAEPRTAVVQVPSHTAMGCLDTLLLPSFEDHCGDACECVDRFCECLESAERGFTNASKLRLRSIIASIVPGNPGISLSYLLEARNCPIQLNHSSFDDLVARFRALLA